MKFKNIRLSSKLFLLTSIIYIIYCPVVILFLTNQQIGHTSFHTSEMFLILGIIRLIVSSGYILDDQYKNEFFSLKLKSYHFYSTLPMVIILLLVPIFDSYYPTSEVKQESTFDSIFGYIIVIAAFGLIFGIGTYIVNILIGISKKSNKKLRTTATTRKQGNQTS